jgi:hypothetical protein
MENKFYILEPTFANKWFWGQVNLDPDDKFFRKAMVGFKGVVDIEIDAGGVAGDFLWNSHGLIVVTEKVLDIWKDFRKFETYRVKIGGKASPAGYTGVVFLGHGGPFDPVKSRVVYSKILGSNGKPGIDKVDGWYFDETKWDGSDLLTIDDLPHRPIATERVIKLMKQAKVTNCYYQPIEKYGHGYDK